MGGRRRLRSRSSFRSIAWRCRAQGKGVLQRRRARVGIGGGNLFSPPVYPVYSHGGGRCWEQRVDPGGLRLGVASWGRGGLERGSEGRGCRVRGWIFRRDSASGLPVAPGGTRARGSLGRSSCYESLRKRVFLGVCLGNLRKLWFSGSFAGDLAGNRLGELRTWSVPGASPLRLWGGVAFLPPASPFFFFGFSPPK